MKTIKKRKCIVALLITGLLVSDLSVFCYAKSTDEQTETNSSAPTVASVDITVDEQIAEDGIQSNEARPGMSDKRLSALEEQKTAEGARENDPEWIASQNARLSTLADRFNVAELETDAMLANAASLNSVINFGIHQFETISDDAFLVTNVVYTSMDIGDGNPQLLNLYVDYDMASSFPSLIGSTEQFVCKTQVKIYYNNGSSVRVLNDTSAIYSIAAFVDDYANYKYTVDLSSYENITRVYVTTRLETTADSVIYYSLTQNKTIDQILAQGSES